jgi:hypothetical protein
VLNILITLIIAPLGKTLKVFRNIGGATDVPASRKSANALGEIPDQCFDKNHLTALLARICWFPGDRYVDVTECK